MKKIIYNKEAQGKLIEGIDLVADAVKLTLGPSGRYMVIGKSFGPPITTKDGVTVARSITSSDPSINIGCEMIKQVASQQLETAGDGTTSATVLAQRIIHLYKDSEKSPREIRDEFKAKTEFIIEQLDLNKKPLETDEELKAVATIATNGDEELGTHVFNAIKASGKDGEVVVENSKNAETKVVSYPGYMFERGYVSHHFAGTNAECKLDDVYILFCDDEIKDWQEIRHIAEAVMAQRRELLIVCKDIAEGPLSNLILNIQQGRLRSCVVKLPALRNRGEILLEDLAIKTGGKVISPKKKGHQLRKVQLEHLGRCDSVTIDKSKTVLVGEKGDEAAIAERKKQIEADLEKADKLEIILQKERYAKFINGVSVLYVGGHSDVDLAERKARIDDAVRATKEALKEGIVPGGGFALARVASDNIQKYDELYSPLSTIASNCNDVFDLEISAKQEVYDFAKDVRGNYIELGIIDPVSVVKETVINAYSVATLVLSTAGMVYNEDFDMEDAVLDGIKHGKDRF